MICKLSCAIAVIFIVGMFNVYYMAEKDQIIQNFMRKLNEPQRESYMKITIERRNISIIGFIIGLLISLIVIWWDWNQARRLTRISLLCLIGSITMVTNYFYYVLTPKSDYMILHLHGEDQKKLWLNVYKKMQYNYHIGLVLGIIGVMFIGNMFCKK